MNSKLAYKIFAGLGVLAFAIGISFTSGFSPAKAQVDNVPNDFNGTTGMMGDIKNPDQFYKEMSDLMKKYGANCPMHGNGGNGNLQGANSGNVKAGVGMMGGGGMMNFNSNIPSQEI